MYILANIVRWIHASVDCVMCAISYNAVRIIDRSFYMSALHVSNDDLLYDPNDGPLMPGLEAHYFKGVGYPL